MNWSATQSYELLFTDAPIKSPMKRKQPWALDEKLMVFGPTLFIVGLGAVSWRDSRTKIIALPVMMNHGNANDGIHDISKIEFSPDSQRLVAVYQGQTGGVATVFDAQTRERLADLQIPPVAAGSRAVSSVIQDACWTLDGAYIAGIYDDGSVGPTKIPTDDANKFRFNMQHHIATWSATSGNLIWTQPYAVTSYDSYAKLQYSSNGKTLIGQGTPAVLFDAATGAPLTPADDSAPTGEFNFDGSLLAVTRKADKVLEVRDVKTRRVLWQPKIKRPFPQWSKNNVLGVFDYRAKNDARLLLWDGKTRRALPTPPAHYVTDFALHPRRLLVAFAEVKLTKSPSPKIESSVLRVWDAATQKELWHRPMTGEINLSWSPDGRWLCAVERAGVYPQATLWIFDAQGAVQSRFSRGAVGLVEWSPNSKTLAITGLNQIEMKSVDSKP